MGVEAAFSGLLPHSTPPHIVYLQQTHSSTVVVLDDVAAHTDFAGDAIVTTLPNIGLAIKTADCAPILLWDEQADVIAAVHSGWQGTLQNLIAPTIAAMCDKGANAADIQAQIGPCLQREQFEVGDDVRQKFIAANAVNTAFFSSSPKHKDKYLFDHTGLLCQQLRDCGVTQIICDAACTLAQSGTYYSYRARHADPIHTTMRNVSLIWREV